VLAARVRFAALLKAVSWVSGNVLRALRFNQCPIALPWFSFGLDEMGRLHRDILSFLKTVAPSKSQRIALAFSVAAWPARTLVAGLMYACRFGGAVSRAHGVTRRFQLRRMLWLAIRHNIAPLSFYRFRLWDESHRGRALHFIQDYELAVLQLWLNRGRDTRPVEDKVALFEKCRAHGLPTAPIVATFRTGEEHWYEGETGTWPLCDLFVKWANLEGGAGAEDWSYDGSAGVWLFGGHGLDAEGLVRRFRERSKIRQVVIQRRLQNHPDTARFSLGGLCTLRVVTYRSDGEGAKVGLLCLRMPVGRTAVDNFVAGGLAAAVDPDTGMLGPAVRKAMAVGSVSHHPDTGARITGERLASWRKLVEVALRAHDCIRDPWSIGWDMAMTPSGPVVVEGNSLWSGDLMQMTRGPIGGTVFAGALSAEVARCHADQSGLPRES
jgi:hypothetical protein